MCRDNGDENSEQHPENKWYHHKPTKLTIAIAGLIIYGFFVFVDAHEIWPWSRFVAVSVGILVTVALLYLEAVVTAAISFRSFLVSSVIIFIAGALIYFVAGPAEVPEVEMIGTLQPGSDTDPPNKCPVPTSNDSWKTIVGNTAIQWAEPLEIRLIKIGKCHVVTIKRDSAGVSVAADLFDSTGRLIAAIKNNEFHALSGEHSRIRRDHDLSTLTVLNGKGQEILHVRYINRATVRVRGIFGCPGHPLVAIKDGEPVPGVMVGSGVCFDVAKGAQPSDAAFVVR
jgi:uncharacterized protein (DUF983 family)